MLKSSQRHETKRSTPLLSAAGGDRPPQVQTAASPTRPELSTNKFRPDPIRPPSTRPPPRPSAAASLPSPPPLQLDPPPEFGSGISSPSSAGGDNPRRWGLADFSDLTAVGAAAAARPKPWSPAVHQQSAAATAAADRQRPSTQNLPPAGQQHRLSASQTQRLDFTILQSNFPITPHVRWSVGRSVSDVRSVIIC